MENSANAPAAPRRRMALHTKILIGMLVGGTLGIVCGQIWPPDESGRPNADLAWYSTNVARPIGQVFFRLIFMVVIPLIFAALATGVAGLGDLRRVGRIGGYSLLMTVVLSTLSVLIAIGMMHTLQPGVGLTESQRALLDERYRSDAARRVADADKSKPPIQALLDIIPMNPLQEMVGALDGSSPGGGLLAIMFFALAFGAALLASGEKGAPVVALLEGVFEACMKIIGFAMRLAPIGVAGLLFALTVDLGLDVLKILGKFVLVGIAGLALHSLLVYPIVLSAVGRMSPWQFFVRSSEAIVTAFGTSSSNATLPTALRVARENLRLRPQVSNFVLTVGATANQNGTALYEGVVVLFLAQVFGVQLDLTQQLTVALMCILGGIGTAGVPGGSLPYIALVLQSVGVPPESIAMIIGVDRILDMCRTVVNVVGDMVIAVCVDRLETAGVGGSGQGGRAGT